MYELAHYKRKRQAAESDGREEESERSKTGGKKRAREVKQEGRKEIFFSGASGFLLSNFIEMVVTHSCI
jgi:hypothetical protein